MVVWPYVSQYAPDCTTFLSAGETFTSLLLALVVLAQNPAADAPLFSGSVFFGVVVALMTVSLAAFLLIHGTAIGARARRSDMTANAAGEAYQPLPTAPSVSVTPTHIVPVPVRRDEDSGGVTVATTLLTTPINRVYENLF